MDEMKFSDFQTKVLCIPEQYDVFLGGGRGGAKSYCMAIIGLRSTSSSTRKKPGFSTSGKATRASQISGI